MRAADWPETEAYAIGPASIAWIMWHIMYWWKNVLSASKNSGIMAKEDVVWPGSAALAIREIQKCHEEWIALIGSLSDEDLRSTELCKWPFEGQSLYALALWLHVEFMKNTAEIGSARFLYATVEGSTRE